MSSLYLQRYAWQKPILSSYDPYAKVGYIVVIPAFNEEAIDKALKALSQCAPPQEEVLVLVVINESVSASKEITARNRRAFDQLSDFQSWYHFEVVYEKLPQKKAGVGLARKIGMDEAVRIFHHFHKDGIIVCFDADCTCDPDYFVSIQKFFTNPNNRLGLVYYEHPLDGDHSEEITNYELFLRYYINALRYTGYPNAVQTLGSCITVRASAYAKQGGMNTRKAGEDFYFIHKVVPLGGIGEIYDTCIRPSDRVSDRVPFGTGHAINKYLQDTENRYEGYNPATFEDLKVLFSTCLKLYEGKRPAELHLPESCLVFYKEMNFDRWLGGILAQSNTQLNFLKRFFAWWDAFRVLKFVHFARDNFHPNVPLEEAASWLVKEHFHLQPLSTTQQHLNFFREQDKNADFYIK